MTRVLLDHNPNAGVVDIEEAEILDIERMGFTVTRLGEAKTAEQPAQPKQKGN